MMVSEARQRLSDDHRAVNEVLKQLLTALNEKDVETSYAKLDLLWARLAVHIRAEHLHLFPAVINRLTESIDHVVAPDLNEAQTIVDKLRADHVFFMRTLAHAVGILRELPRQLDSADSEASLPLFTRKCWKLKNCWLITTKLRRIKSIVGPVRF